MPRSPDDDPASGQGGAQPTPSAPTSGAPPQADPRERALAKTMGLPDLLARVLLARGLDDPARIRSFLRPDLGDLGDPLAFTHMGRATARIREAVARGEPIMIHGEGSGSRSDETTGVVSIDSRLGTSSHEVSCAGLQSVPVQGLAEAFVGTAASRQRHVETTALCG